MKDNFVKFKGKGNFLICSFTSKSFSEVLILASTNPQYDKRLSIELPVHYMKIPSSEHCQNMLCTQIVLNVKTKTKMYKTCSELGIFIY